MQTERRKEKRQKIGYYMRVVDANTLQPIGYLTEISRIGIRLDCEKPIPIGANFKMSMDLAPDIASKSFMAFNGRCKWCQVDKLNPNSYNVGFEVNLTARDDQAIFQRMIESYG